MSNPIPPGYMLNAQGNLVPEANVKKQHKLEDQLVRRMAELADGLSQRLTMFKHTALQEAEELKGLVAKEYGVILGGKKGNTTLKTFDGTIEMQISVSETMAFGPELDAAKVLIDACVRRWAEGANDNIRALIDHAFQVNKTGKIDTQRVLGLRQLKIDDDEWKRAMEAISDALRVSQSKTYLRLYKVDRETGDKKPISLDIASL